MIARRLCAGALLVAVSGCGARSFDVGFSCPDPDESHLGADGLPDPCHERDAVAGGEPGCAVGTSNVHWAALWADPALLWVGPEDQAPECPRGQVSVAYEGYDDLVAPTACEACACEPPTGSCALPSTLTASTAVCPGGPLTTSFDAPTPWDGLCDNTLQTPPGAAHSLTIGALAMIENGCTPAPPVPAKVLSLHWNTFARACDMPWRKPTVRSLCLTDEPFPVGFAMCILRDGEHDCPADPGNVFTEQHFFYNGVQDNRQCSACTCGPPMGSACTPMISIYKDDVCSAASAVAQISVSSADDVCLDIALPGQELKSKSAGPTTYLPGTCPAMGGDPSGSAIKTNPVTSCCRP